MSDATSSENADEQLDIDDSVSVASQSPVSDQPFHRISHALPKLPGQTTLPFRAVKRECEAFEKSDVLSVACQSAVVMPSSVNTEYAQEPAQADIWSLGNDDSSSSSTHGSGADESDNDNIAEEKRSQSSQRPDRSRSPRVCGVDVRMQMPSQQAPLLKQSFPKDIQFWAAPLWRALEPLLMNTKKKAGEKINIHCLCAGTAAELHALKAHATCMRSCHGAFKSWSVNLWNLLLMSVSLCIVCSRFQIMILCWEQCVPELLLRFWQVAHVPVIMSIQRLE